MKRLYYILLVIIGLLFLVNKSYSQDIFVYKDSITIPIVFHIVYRIDEEKVSLDDIYSQIDVLNEDFNAKNLDLHKVPEPFRPHIASANIKFCIQEIRYVHTYVKSFTYVPFFERLKFTTSGGDNIVEPDKYLNIYVCNLRTLAGQSQLPGLNKKTDGIIIDYRYFGRLRNDSTVPYKILGRTATHEVGHWLGLFHLWGEQNSTIKNDYCEDTPLQDNPTKGCPSFPLTDRFTKKYPGIMFNNFMDYTYDECALFFTKDQVFLMWENLYTLRSGILENNR